MNQTSNKVVKNYIYNTSYQILVMIAPLITMPYISRVLGATGIGIYNYGQSIATYFIYIAEVGTTIYGQREIAYAQDDPELRSRIFWEITLFRFLTVAISTIVYFFIFGSGLEYSFIYRVLTIEVVATAFDISWFFMGIERFRVTMIRNMLVRVIGIVAVFIFVKSPDDVIVYTLCIILPLFVGNISLWISLPKYLVRVHIQAKNVFRHVRPSFLLFVPQLAIQIYAILDRTMLGALGTDISEVGYYTQASRIVRIALTLVTSLGTVMLPAMSVAFSKGQKDVIFRGVQKAFRFVFMLGFALLFGICAVAKNFVPIFFGPGYDQVIVLMLMISPIIVIIGCSNVLGRQYLLPTKQERWFTVSVVIGAAVNVCLNAILIIRFNAIGASIATVCAELAVTITQALVARRQLNLKKCFSPFWRYLICGVIMFAVVYLLGEVLGGSVVVLVFQIVVGVAVYAIELAIIKDEMFREGIQRVFKRIART